MLPTGAVFDLNHTNNELSSSAFMLASPFQKVTLSPTDSWPEDTSSSCTQVVKQLEILPNFETEQVRKRRKKQQFEYEAQEEALRDLKQKFKVSFYYAAADMAIQTIEERFQQLQQDNSPFGFLYAIYSINKISSEDVLKTCKNLEKSWIHNGNNNTDAESLCYELLAITKNPKSMPPQQKLLDNMPNVSFALHFSHFQGQWQMMDTVSQSSNL